MIWITFVLLYHPWNDYVIKSRFVTLEEEDPLLKQLVNKHYDYRTGLLGAAVMGGIVYWINADHGFWLAIPAAFKQAGYTAIAGGLLTKICERMANKFENLPFSIFMGVLVPSVIAVTLTYAVHMLKGTPEPLNSTIPTMLLAPFGFLFWGWRRRRQRDKAVSLVSKSQASSTPSEIEI